MKKIIVTGVTGQDGSHMVDYLLKNTEHTVIGGVRRLSVKNHENIAHLKDNPRFFLIDLDVTDAQNTDRVVAEHKPDYFINFAANSFVGSSWEMPVNHMQTNCMAVLHQLEAIRRHALHAVITMLVALRSLGILFGLHKPKTIRCALEAHMERLNVPLDT